MNSNLGPRVFILKEQMVRDATGSNAQDYSPAMAYGEIEFITSSDIPLHPNSSIRAVWDDDVTYFCKTYDESKDFIVCSGQPIAIFMVGFALSAAGKTPRFLVWRREQGRYQVVDMVKSSI